MSGRIALWRAVADSAGGAVLTAVQEFVVATTDQLTPIPAEVPLSIAAPVLCAGLTSGPGLRV